MNSTPSREYAEPTLTPKEHYHEAESWLHEAGKDGYTVEERANLLAVAQVHASLAAVTDAPGPLVSRR